jgi:hypothetical protein
MKMANAKKNPRIRGPKNAMSGGSKRPLRNSEPILTNRKARPRPTKKNGILRMMPSIRKATKRTQNPAYRAGVETGALTGFA